MTPRPQDLMHAGLFRLFARREATKARLASVQKRLDRECARAGVSESAIRRLSTINSQPSTSK